ncbi:MAG: C4-type zinc ribbon domain-containing protein [Candidatus Binatota bacterium]
MREQIEILASLQNVDREIREKSGVKVVLLAEIQKKEEEIQTKRADIALFRAEWSEKDKQRQEKEQLLQEESKKATEKRMRMNRIKNIKELQALQREIDQIKLGNSQLEEELIKLLEEAESYASALRAKEEELKQLEAAWREKQGEIEAQVAGIERAVAEASALRQAIATRLNRELIERYELIFSRRGGMAVVTVSDGICQGCYMNIPPQLWNEIIKSEKLILCPSCHRILYSKPTVPNDKQL